MNQSYDVAVIGSSVSGASLAVQLGQQGLDVALIDRRHFPRRKACGEGVSDMAVNALYRMGFSPADINSLGGKPFYSYRLEMGNHSINFAEGKERTMKGIGLQRFLLDAMIVDRAASLPSVDVFFGDAVSDFEHEGERETVCLSSGQKLKATHVVLADGANSPCSKRLGISEPNRNRGLWGISYILEGEYKSVTGEVAVLLKEGCEIYCTPVSDSKLNVAFLMPKENVRRFQNEDLRQTLLAEACERSSFQGVAIEDPLQTGPLGKSKRPYFSDSFLLIGDAAESLDPISGMGITHGILSSELAAKALLSIHREGKAANMAFQDYARECAEMSRSLRGFTRLTSSLLRSRLRNSLLPVLSGTALPFQIRNALSSRFAGQAHSGFVLGAFLNLIGI